MSTTNPEYKTDEVHALELCIELIQRRIKDNKGVAEYYDQCAKGLTDAEFKARYERRADAARVAIELLTPNLAALERLLERERGGR